MRRLMPWVVTLVFFLVIGGAALWGRQQDTGRRVAEARADALEAEVAGLQVTVTAIVRAQAATATAVAVAANLPEVSLRNALDLVLQAYKDPSDARLNALQAAFDAPALSIERPEAEHLISGGTHLGGQSAYEILSMQTNDQAEDHAEIQTREEWIYDEVDAQNRRSRCVREETEQTYTLRRAPAGWIVADVSLSGAGRRSEC